MKGCTVAFLVVSCLIDRCGPRVNFLPNIDRFTSIMDRGAILTTFMLRFENFESVYSRLRHVKKLSVGSCENQPHLIKPSSFLFVLHMQGLI